MKKYHITDSFLKDLEEKRITAAYCETDTEEHKKFGHIITKEKFLQLCRNGENVHFSMFYRFNTKELELKDFDYVYTNPKLIIKKQQFQFIKTEQLIIE